MPFHTRACRPFRTNGIFAILYQDISTLFCAIGSFCRIKKFPEMENITTINICIRSIIFFFLSFSYPRSLWNNQWQSRLFSTRSFKATKAKKKEYYYERTDTTDNSEYARHVLSIPWTKKRFVQRFIHKYIQRLGLHCWALLPKRLAK